MEFTGKWIRTGKNMGDVCPVFKKEWLLNKKMKSAKLFLTARGVYSVRLNGKKISDYVLAPGWTVYSKRLQYQEYDITDFVSDKNELTVVLGKGWFSSSMPGWIESEDKERRKALPCGILGEVHLTYEDGGKEIIGTDSSWQCAESPVRFSEIYDGETYDASFVTKDWEHSQEEDWPKDILIPQEGEIIKEQERVAAKEIIRTPKGETLVDFGQEVTGYVEFTVNAHENDKIRILHGEVLDQEGNFYNANYRSAKAQIIYNCAEGRQTWHPMLTYFGFRYIKLAEFPGEVSCGRFTAVAVYSDIKRTGVIRCSDSRLNQLFSNIFWGQRGNFLDVPTDCPQRDERLGWTGDAQVFAKTASYNFDVEKFFAKWLHDMAADQGEDGSVGQVIPNYLPDGLPSAAWGDAAAICPWQIYMAYGNKTILEDQFECMKKWVDYITGSTKDEYLWTGGTHFGDWLGLDSPPDSYRGASREDFIASAFYAHSTDIVIRAGKVLGKNVAEYEKLYRNILKKFRNTYKEYHTQTEIVLAVYFNLAEEPKKAAEQLVGMIKRDGVQMKTGFVGTPYILHVLTDYGYTELAYSLLLREEYPSWLYQVRRGATTVWEHWDGIKEDGTFWSTDMNSFNHYAYGAVADWVYEAAAGIKPLEEAPGFKTAVIEPHPDKRLKWLDVSLNTRNGKINVYWENAGETVRYNISVDMPALIKIGGKSRKVLPGNYTFWG